jgi:hypothetical protein
MWRRFLVLGLLCVASAGCAASPQPATKTGVAGRVIQTPATPGPQRLGQEVRAAPVARVEVQLRNQQESVVAHTTTGEDGSFELEAPAGQYTLHVAVQGMYPRCQSAPVTIRTGRLAKVDVECDSGMR